VPTNIDDIKKEPSLQGLNNAGNIVSMNNNNNLSLNNTNNTNNLNSTTNNINLNSSSTNNTTSVVASTANTVSQHVTNNLTLVDDVQKLQQQLQDIKEQVRVIILIDQYFWF
jgi:hypothetical protein